MPFNSLKGASHLKHKTYFSFFFVLDIKHIVTLYFTVSLLHMLHVGLLTFIITINDAYLHASNANHSNINITQC